MTKHIDLKDVQIWGERESAALALTGGRQDFALIPHDDMDDFGHVALYGFNTFAEVLAFETGLKVADRDDWSWIHTELSDDTWAVLIQNTDGEGGLDSEWGYHDFRREEG